MIIDCISDLHGFYPKLDGGDLLIIAGDLTAKDTFFEYGKFFEWLAHQQYRKKILIAGNHDGMLEKRLIKEVAREICGMGADNFDYLCDSGIEFEGLKIWGSPWAKTFKGMNRNCMAFTYDTEEEMAEKWGKIPHDLDILITHSPSYGILDEVRKIKSSEKINIGSIHLRDCLERIKPKLYVFGHIHEHGGKQILFKHTGPNTICVNSSHVNEHYEPVNKPIRVILDNEW